MNLFKRLIAGIRQAIAPKDQFGRRKVQTPYGPKYVGGTPPKIFKAEQAIEVTPTHPEPVPPLKIYREE